MKEKLSAFYAKDSTQKVVASLLSILIGHLLHAGDVSDGVRLAPGPVGASARVHAAFLSHRQAGGPADDSVPSVDHLCRLSQPRHLCAELMEKHAL